jgi:hypothetical protein
MDVYLLIGLLFIFVIGIWIISVFVRRNTEKKALAEINQLPEPLRSEKLQERQLKKQWGCLNGYLLLVMLANIVVAGLTFLYASSSNRTDSSIYIFSGGLNLLAALFAAVIYWGHKKWAVYGIFAIIGFSLLINLASGNTQGAVQNILPILILWAGLRPVWGQME